MARVADVRRRREQWVADTYRGTGTPGGQGGFVYLRDSAYADSNPSSECASCHQPEAWIESPYGALIDPRAPTPAVAHGISCEVCHKIAAVNESRLNFPGRLPHRKRSLRRDRLGYRRYYTEETRRMVATRYTRDIELFGYGF